MDWNAFGFTQDPFQTTPITKSNLELFTGHQEEINVCQNALIGGNIRLLIEGDRGVGTTSFANYLRFHESQKLYFTPRNEIKVDQGWRLETLLTAIISSFIREIELLDNNEQITSDERFKNAKSLSTRIHETYKAFGLDIFSVGGNYSKQGQTTQPIFVPASQLGIHIEDLIALIKDAGYKNGVLFQLNNLDVGEMHSTTDMKYILNALRDYTQIDGSSWILVGDKGLKKFIAQHVDRLDDIISYEVVVNPIAITDLPEVIKRRVNLFRESSKVEFPIENEVFEYIYNITKGRLRFVFGLVSRLLNALHVGSLTNKITLELAKPALNKLGHDRLNSRDIDITPSEEQILLYIVTHPMSIKDISTEVKKSSQYVGRVIKHLEEKNLISIKHDGREKTYVPSIDAVIAYCS